MNVKESVIAFLLKFKLLTYFPALIPFIMLGLEHAISKSTWTTRNTALFRFNLYRCTAACVRGDENNFAFVTCIFSHVTLDEIDAIYYFICCLISPTLVHSSAEKYIGMYVSQAEKSKLKCGPWTLLTAVRKGYNRIFGSPPDVGPCIFLWEVIIWVEKMEMHLSRDVGATGRLLMVLLGSVYALRRGEIAGSGRKRPILRNLIINTPLTLNWLYPHLEELIVMHFAPTVEEGTKVTKINYTIPIENGQLILLDTKTDFRNQNVAIHFKAGAGWLCIIDVIKKHMWARKLAGETFHMKSPLIAVGVNDGRPKAATVTDYDEVVKMLAEATDKEKARTHALRRGATSSLMAAGGVTELEKDVFMRHNIFSLANYLQTDPNWITNLHENHILYAIQTAKLFEGRPF